MPKGFTYGNAKVDSEVKYSPNDISKPIGDMMLFTSIGEKLIEISQGEFPIDPLTPLELYGYATNTPTTPPEIVARFGEKIGNNKRKTDLSQFEYRMRNYGFNPISSNPIGSLYPKKIPNGIVLPPSASLVLLIPLRASSTEGDYYVDWTLPYWYTTKSVPNPSTWDGNHIDKQTQSIKRMIEVKVPIEDTTPNSDGSVIGNWLLNFDWNCKGSPSQTTLNLHSDGTLDIPEFSLLGKWEQSGDTIHLQWYSHITKCL